MEQMPLVVSALWGKYRSWLFAWAHIGAQMEAASPCLFLPNRVFKTIGVSTLKSQHLAKKIGKKSVAKTYSLYSDSDIFMTSWRCIHSEAALFPDAGIASNDEKSGIGDGGPLNNPDGLLSWSRQCKYFNQKNTGWMDGAVRLGFISCLVSLRSLWRL